MQDDPQTLPLYPTVDTAGRPPLKIGVMLDGFQVEAWMHRILRDVANAPFAQIAVVIVNREHWRHQASAWENLRTGRFLKTQEFFWRYVALDEHRNPNSHSPFRMVNVKPLLDNIPVIDVTPVRRGFVHRFREDDVARVQALELDVILRFGFNILRGKVLQAARFGIWSYHHGDNMRYRGGPAMFWELYRGEPVLGSILQRLTDDLDNGQVLYRSFTARQNTVWLSRTRAQPFWKSTAFALRSLRRCHWEGAVPSEPQNKNMPKGRLYRAPSNLQMLGFAAQCFGRSLAGNLRSKLGRSQWLLAYRRRIDAGPDNLAKGDFEGFRPIFPPRGHSYADPFLIAHEGQTYCLFEMIRPGSHGCIACLRFDTRGVPSAIQMVLKTDYHLSYPFVFAWQGGIYMMPEMGSQRALRVFEARRFPHDWVQHSELHLPCPAYDPTLAEKDGCWFLFLTADERGGGSDDELFLFHGPTPLGPWQPHSLNPVVSDVRSARPAGRPFYRDGRLIRPSQDCSESYGSAICLCEVEVLTPTGYRERVVASIKPTWRPGLTGMHTYNAEGDIEVLDARRFHWR